MVWINICTSKCSSGSSCVVINAINVMQSHLRVLWTLETSKWLEFIFGSAPIQSCPVAANAPPFDKTPFSTKIWHLLEYFRCEGFLLEEQQRSPEQHMSGWVMDKHRQQGFLTRISFTEIFVFLSLKCQILAKKIKINKNLNLIEPKVTCYNCVFWHHSYQTVLSVTIIETFKCFFVSLFFQLMSVSFPASKIKHI